MSTRGERESGLLDEWGRGRGYLSLDTPPSPPLEAGRSAAWWLCPPIGGPFGPVRLDGMKRCIDCSIKAAMEGGSRCKGCARRKGPKNTGAHQSRTYRQNRAYVLKRFREQPIHAQTCGLCRAGAVEGDGWVVDHVLPLARGGTHHVKNLMVVHDICNNVKSDRTMIECFGTDELRRAFLQEVRRRRLQF